MEKDQPPPYPAATGTHPLPGFGAPPPPSSQPQPYPPEHGHPQSYPPQHGPLPYPSQPGHPQPGYPQPQHSYAAPPVQIPGSTTVIVTSAPAYGPHPQPMTCPQCYRQMTTRIDLERSLSTHMFALLCCLMGCIPCCLIPYFMDSCHTKNHYCPHCGAYLGNYDSTYVRNRRW